MAEKIILHQIRRVWTGRRLALRKSNNMRSIVLRQNGIQKHVNTLHKLRIKGKLEKNNLKSFYSQRHRQRSALQNAHIQKSRSLPYIIHFFYSSTHWGTETEIMRFIVSINNYNVVMTKWSNEKSYKFLCSALKWSLTAWFHIMSNMNYIFYVTAKLLHSIMQFDLTF